MNIEETKINHPFKAPASYFERLESEIISQKNIAILSNNNPFSVTEKYFNQLENQILSEISLQKLKKPSNLKVPENYFENLEEQILSEVNLLKFKKVSLFEKEDIYFENLEKQVLKNTISANTSNISVFRRFATLYRSAAAILLFGAIGIMVYNQNKQKDQFAEISNADMLAYLSNETLLESDITPVLDEKALNELNVITINNEISEKDLLLYTKENDI